MKISCLDPLDAGLKDLNKNVSNHLVKCVFKNVNYVVFII